MRMVSQSRGTAGRRGIAHALRARVPGMCRGGVPGERREVGRHGLLGLDEDVRQDLLPLALGCRGALWRQPRRLGGPLPRRGRGGLTTAAMWATARALWSGAVATHSTSSATAGPASSPRGGVAPPSGL